MWNDYQRYSHLGSIGGAGVNAIKDIANWAERRATDARDRQAIRAPEKPTDERRSKGKWIEPKGIAKHSNPMVDLTCDWIGELYEAKKITSPQEQAARLFQELRAAYLAELGTKGYGSCLADNQQGYDAGDGDPEAIKRYRSLEQRIGRVKTACLVLVTEGRKVDLGALRRALDEVAR